MPTAQKVVAVRPFLPFRSFSVLSICPHVRAPPFWFIVYRRHGPLTVHQATALSRRTAPLTAARPRLTAAARSSALLPLSATLGLWARATRPIAARHRAFCTPAFARPGVANAVGAGRPSSCRTHHGWPCTSCGTSRHCSWTCRGAGRLDGTARKRERKRVCVYVCVFVCVCVIAPAGRAAGVGLPAKPASACRRHLERPPAKHTVPRLNYSH